MITIIIIRINRNSEAGETTSQEVPEFQVHYIYAAAYII